MRDEVRRMYIDLFMHDIKTHKIIALGNDGWIGIMKNNNSSIFAVRPFLDTNGCPLSFSPQKTLTSHSHASDDCCMGHPR